MRTAFEYEGEIRGVDLLACLVTLWRENASGSLQFSRSGASAGLEIAVISGRRSPMVAARCRELGVRHVLQGVGDKLAALTRLCARLKLTPAACACVGDDLPDVPIMRAAALSFAVADAHRAARRAADVVTRLPGGRGAVREVCDHLLALNARRARRR